MEIRMMINRSGKRMIMRFRRICLTGICLFTVCLLCSCLMKEDSPATSEMSLSSAQSSGTSEAVMTQETVEDKTGLTGSGDKADTEATGLTASGNKSDTESTIMTVEKDDTGSGKDSGTGKDSGSAEDNVKEEDMEADSVNNTETGRENNTATGQDEELRVILGDEQSDEYIPLLEGRRVALFSNQTGIVGDRTSLSEADYYITHDLIQFGYDTDGNEITYGQHILDALTEQGINVTAIFSPEHGFRGTEDAGKRIDDSVDEKTGIPVYSMLRMDSHYPSAESMDAFDVLVVDIQDVGLRYYTYYISMYYLMDACAAAGKEVMVLDRPNPNGYYIDGPILKNEYRSQVGQLPIPVVHGMTMGELALMINGEGWLKAGKDACKLSVIPCRNYSHSTRTGLIMKPSPNLKDMRAVYLYASTCFFENTVISVDRGTEMPFEIYGSPYLSEADYTYSFTPVSMTAAVSPPFMDELCHGKSLRDIPLTDII